MNKIIEGQAVVTCIGMGAGIGPWCVQEVKTSRSEWKYIEVENGNGPGYRWVNC